MINVVAGSSTTIMTMVVTATAMVNMIVMTRRHFCLPAHNPHR